MRAASTSHVFASKDAGTNWRDIDRRRLPNVSHCAVEFDGPARAYFCGEPLRRICDCGFRDDVVSGLSGNLPAVPVMDLVYHDGDRTLTAATYGRGLWRARAGKQ